MNQDQAVQAALQHHRAGRLPEAEAGYRKVLAAVPNHPDALHLLGQLAMQMGHASAAVELLSKAVAAAPNIPDYFNGLGNALSADGRHEDATAAFQRAIALAPNHFVALNNLGNELKRLNRFDAALSAYSQALAINPALAHAHNGTAAVYLEQLQYDAAIASARKAISIDPNLGDAWNNLGATLEKTGRIDESLKALETAVRLVPESAEPLLNLANSLRAAGQFRQAVSVLERAIALNPRLAEAHLNLAILLLLLGDLPRGFAEFEWRWQCRKFPSPRWKTNRPHWRGEPLEGRTILLHAEQGLGDSIQFVRFARQAAAKGGRVLVLCAPTLAELLASAPGVERVVSEDAIPRIDVHCPLMSLPLALGTRLDTIPADRVYLHADPEKVAAWKKRLLPPDHRRRVGLVWAGNPDHAGDRHRSMDARQLLPLARAPNLAFYSLQKGPPAAQATDISAELSLVDLTEQLTDFSQTAALIENLDLVISVDTSVAHLAAALGKPTWIFLPANPDWRWLLQREDSPWYPTVRLFRQRRLGDWNQPIEQAADALVKSTVRGDVGEMTTH